MNNKFILIINSLLLKATKLSQLISWRIIKFNVNIKIQYLGNIITCDKVNY